MKHIKTLLKLKEQGELNYSAVPKSLIDHLKDEMLIDIITLSAKRKKIVVKEQFYKVYKDIENIDNATTRKELIESNIDTKAKNIAPQEGLYLNGNCEIENVKLPLFNNSAIFLKEPPEISKDILIIGLENFENLVYFQSQTRYFQNNNILFVYRNSTMRKWFESLENEIIYFGDFDLAGIDIYLNEILPRNKNIRLFIPKDIENLIKNHGSNELYKKQLNKCTNLSSTIQNIQTLIDVINDNQKGLEQEYFI
ncbi:MAG: hypothetical protein U9O56_05170 [Campylobacterota bacterium]|nr:hypothetical protein [Campylobacterota bacterium]